LPSQARALEEAQAPHWRAWMRQAISAGHAAYLLLGVILLGLDHLLGPAPTAKWVVTVVALALVLVGCWRRGGALAWVVLLIGLVLFLEVRAVADNLGFPLHTEDLWQLESALFAGHIPTQVLQAALFTPGRFGPADYFSVGIHWSYFFVPYLAVFAIWLRDPQATRDLAYPLALTFAVSLVIYALLPGTPPWLAAAEPAGPRVYRIVYFVWNSVSPEAYARIYEVIGDPNPVACLPSVHFAITFMLFLYSLGRRRLWVVASGLYALAMVWSLVYLGEHYVVDVILGGAVAYAVWYAYRRLARQVSWGAPASPADRTGGNGAA
jgi:membrane-associated phospholipid phosphatase